MVRSTSRSSSLVALTLLWFAGVIDHLAAATDFLENESTDRHLGTRKNKKVRGSSKKGSPTKHVTVKPTTHHVVTRKPTRAPITDAPTSSPSQAFCNRNYQDSINNRVYGIVTTPMTWQQAREYASTLPSCCFSSLSPQLVMITTSTKDSFLASKLQELQISDVWMGLHFNNVTTALEWVDTSESYPGSYTNWLGGSEPTLAAQKASPCVYVTDSTGTLPWSVDDCNTKRMSVVELACD